MLYRLRSRHGRRGFTISEIVIASSLAIGFALLVSTALVTTSTLAGKNITRAAMAADSRVLADAASRYLRGAAPPGMCLDPKREAWPLNACSRVGERTSAFALANGSRAVFYTYGTSNATVTGSSVLTTPDKVEIVASGEELIIYKYAAISPNDPNRYTNPSWTGTPEVVRKFRITGDSEVFEYYDASRTRLGTSGDLTEEELARVSLVKFTPRLQTVIRGETRTHGIDVTVPVGSSAGNSGLRE